ncbi:MAG TPA: LLM class flavin-dependent oxidoreductase [Acetobacteraceae bacterium]|nr:LLM class flavin-dependent oxidoreductase [Acetobacteraceae bacterium]
MKQIRLNAFDMNCVGHIQQGLWRHPRDRSMEYTRLDHWVELARLLERGLFDGLFLADVLGVYDVHGGSPAPAIAHAVQIPVNDPLLLIPAMAHATQHLGFGVTANLSYEPPFTFARRMSTLDHLTRGRIGWNVVTGYLDSAARAMGLDRQRSHDDRYDVADEYMQVVYGLWERSWADDAVMRDRESGSYADPFRVRAIQHAGAHYRVDAIHLCEPSPQRTPVLYQAGSSGRGRRFAGAHAECVFLNGQAKPAVRAHVDAIRAEAVAHGRAPGDVLAFVGATVIVAETDALAQAKLADYRRYASPEAALVHASASMGVDLDRFDMDEPFGAAPTQAIASNLQAMAQQGMTKRKLLERMVLGSRQPPIVGSASAVADELLAWVEQADVDGFILSRTVTPECFEDFIDLVVPELQRRGAYKEAYAPGTLREKLFGAGPHLPPTHPAASADEPRHGRA